MQAKMNMVDNFDINAWLEDFRKNLLCLFGKRLRFLGLQGSYGRGEQTADSDIDVVVIVDDMSHYDMLSYRNMIDAMDHSSMICGFVAGTSELRGWEKSDLLQLYLDTKPVIGSLDSFGFFFTKEDVRRAVHKGACNIYHACSHNFLHARNMGMLTELYKSARFTVRMKYYCETGEYVASFCRLSEVVYGEDRNLLACATSMSEGIKDNLFDGYSLMLMDWAADTIGKMHKA